MLASNGMEPDTATHGELARRGRAVAIVSIVAAILVAYIAQAALPKSTFGLPGVSRTAVKVMVPEGWSFFTASPRAPSTVAYVLDANGSWRPLGEGVLSQPGDLFGANRTWRAQGSEMALVLAGVRSNAWATCTLHPQLCLSGLHVQATLKDTARHKTICGDIGFVRQEVLPWAWRKASTTTIMPSRVFRARVTC